MGPRPLFLLLLALLGACRTVTQPGVEITSSPSGARVMIDGRYAGHVTPCLIALETDERYEVRIELDGYEPYGIAFVPSQREGFIGWDAGRLSWSGMQFGLWHEAVDLFQPVRIDRTHSPGRVFVRMRPRAD